MSDTELLEKIVMNTKIMGGKPIIRGTRLTVELILNLLAYGSTTDEIIQEYKTINSEDIKACLLFATKSLESSSFLPLAASNE